MVAIAAPVAQVTDLVTLSPTAQAAALGYPATLFGCTPADQGYWLEPGLPWWTPEMRENPPLGYNGYPRIPYTAYIAGPHMAPRFPEGCGVMLAPVYEKKNLVVGRVYCYSYRNSATGEVEMTIGRLEKIGGNSLWVRADNEASDGPTLGACWLLEEEEAKAVWHVYEVTHYVSYPSEPDTY